MKQGSALNDPQTSKTLDRLYLAARGDWRRMLYYQGSESAPFSGVRKYPILRDNK